MCNDKLTTYTPGVSFTPYGSFPNRRTNAEVIDYSEYEPKIRKLIDEYVGAEDITIVNELVNIFDKEAFEKEIENITGKAARADTIASRTKKTITEKWAEDPAFYKKFSKLLSEVIADYRQRRIDEAAYLLKVTEIMNNVRDNKESGLPESLKSNDSARAYYGLIHELFQECFRGNSDISDISTNAGLDIDKIIEESKRVNWQRNPDAQKQMAQQTDDYFFELQEEKNLNIDLKIIDKLIETIIQTAINRSK